MRKRQVVAERELLSLVTDPPTTITARIFVPYESDGAWKCAFEVVGMTDGAHAAVGEDSMQALQMAIEGIRATLAPISAQLSWCGEVGFVGFSMNVPISYGPRVQHQLEDALVRQERHLVEQELESRKAKGSPKL